ncbi:concanavalin A-like lectin/glucanase [Lojkania enalia]|uniref:Concanavalin A-like lectin/glucanase n=1 Tax=Lojkania enalia TaxID=147567 RepID=A0A9P4N6I6_9PLEO|nr:concanavalin A-like lectin/glucanase [Didymosphaeria enalia]
MLCHVLAAILGLILALSNSANAACECGYSVNKTSDQAHAVYTELMENDFLHTMVENATEVGWRPQEYNMSAEQARGPYGKEFFVSNIETNPLKDPWSWSGESQNGQDAGLELWVRGDHSHGFVSGSEVVSVRNDMTYGSYRIGMKLPRGDSGTCAAFFWYYNNSQEIDMEFLSHQFNGSTGAVNLVLQTPEAVNDGFDASNTSVFKVYPLGFRPDEKFHEYRFDWSPESVAFYIDGELAYVMAENVPTTSSHLFMNHWSNGDPSWSAGPPDSDVAMTVSYVKAYFNSSDPARADAYNSRCSEYNPANVCQIPDQTVPPDPSGPDGNTTAKTYFFSLDEGHAPGQTVYNHTNGDLKGGAMGMLDSVPSFSVFAPFFIALFSWVFTL